jgi:hypothetical protein
VTAPAAPGGGAAGSGGPPLETSGQQTLLAGLAPAVPSSVTPAPLAAAGESIPSGQPQGQAANSLSREVCAPAAAFWLPTAPMGSVWTPPPSRGWFETSGIWDESSLDEPEASVIDMDKVMTWSSE